MLSNTLIGNGFGCWKTIVTRRRSAVGSISAMSMPSSVIWPRQRGVLVQLGQPVQRAQQRRLAAARRADQRQHLALADWQRDRVDGQLAAVGDRQLVDLHPVDRDRRRAGHAATARPRTPAHRPRCRWWPCRSWPARGRAVVAGPRGAGTSRSRPVSRRTGGGVLSSMQLPGAAGGDVDADVEGQHDDQQHERGGVRLGRLVALAGGSVVEDVVGQGAPGPAQRRAAARRRRPGRSACRRAARR